MYKIFLLLLALSFFGCKEQGVYIQPGNDPSCLRLLACEADAQRYSKSDKQEYERRSNICIEASTQKARDQSWALLFCVKRCKTSLESCLDTLCQREYNDCN